MTKEGLLKEKEFYEKVREEGNPERALQGFQTIKGQVQPEQTELLPEIISQLFVTREHIRQNSTAKQKKVEEQIKEMEKLVKEGFEIKLPQKQLHVIFLRKGDLESLGNNHAGAEQSYITAHNFALQAACPKYVIAEYKVHIAKAMTEIGKTDLALKTLNSAINDINEDNVARQFHKKIIKSTALARRFPPAIKEKKYFLACYSLLHGFLIILSLAIIDKKPQRLKQFIQESKRRLFKK